MLDLATFTVFITAAFTLAVIPGPGMFYVLTRTLRGGRREGVLSTAGTGIAGLVHTFAAALGVSAILATSAAAFAVVKWLGAAYLVYLGMKTLLGGARSAPHEIEASASGGALRQGVVAEVLNPKTALFFLAFLPQFVDPSRGHAAAQTALLGALFAAQTVLIFGAIGYYAGTVGGWLRGRPAVGRWLDRATGVLFIGLGIRLALAGRN